MFESVPKNYWQQCQVLMFRKKRTRARLYAYEMTDEDYANPYSPNIDYTRIKPFFIRFDKDFIKNEYKPRLRYLAHCLRRKIFPTLKGFEEFNKRRCRWNLS